MVKQALFINIETTGIPPKNTKLTEKTFKKWPRLLALHLKVGTYDKDEKKINITRSIYTLIKPDKFIIPEDTVKIHGITNELAIKNGNDIKLVLNKLDGILDTVFMIVGHNTNFRLECIMAEYMRLGIPPPQFKRTSNRFKIVDTMNFNHNFDYPKLEDLHFHLFEKRFKKSHPRKSNINIVVKCFGHLYTQFLKKIKEQQMKIPDVPVEEPKYKKKTKSIKSQKTRKKIMLSIQRSRS
jgi:DNA polymerase III epsilon subunit-like protein